MHPRHRQNLLIAAFLLISLLLHLLLFLMPEQGLLRFAEPAKPVYVEIRPPERRDRELDLAEKPPPPKPRQTPAKRLGPQDQVVRRETAPQGKDAEDWQPSSRTPPRQATPPAPPRPAPPAPAEADEPQRPTTPTGERPTSRPRQAPQTSPTLEQLTRLAPSTVERMERDWRRKYREGVEKGDTVWLDTEQDLLISFFRRFRTNIYNVWNYPERARLRGEEGECLLRIVVSRQGTIDDVELLESSGSFDLDQEAIGAVRQGQPYGPLPAAYPHQQLNIMAYFRYSLSGGFKYPGRIYGER